MSEIIVKNLEDFNSGKTNICLITGLSGSGKTTEALNMLDNNNIHIELDLFEQCYLFPDLNELRQKAGDVFYEYFTEHPGKYQALQNKEFLGLALGNEIKKFLEYVLLYCREHNDKKYIIEGVQIYCFLDVEENKDLAYIVINKSFISCMLKRIKRSITKDKEKLKNLELIKMFNWYRCESEILKTFIEVLKTI